MKTKRDSDPQTECIVVLAEWIKEYCGHLSDEIAKKKLRINSEYAQHLISQWTESTLIFVAESTQLPCPSCEELIPLQLDDKQVGRIITSVVKDKEETKAKEYDIDRIKDKIAESADIHLIPCEGHNKDCPFSRKGWIALSKLISE